MKIKSTLFALLALAVLTCGVQAQEMQEKSAECEGECPIAAAMGELPKMTYKVGEEATCCSESAAALAQEHSLPIHFVVGENTFEEKEAAVASLVEVTEAYVNDFITPCKCEVSGTTKIAGTACNCPIKAGETTQLVKAAADEVQMTYAVGETECNCPKKAAALADASDAEKMYVVGEEKTCCEMSARLNLARAKYKAAVQALAANEKAGS